MQPIETFEVNGNTVKIYQDEDPQNPRTEWDNLSVMVFLHSRYNLGDKHWYSFRSFGGWGEVKADIIQKFKPVVILPVFMYDHSGITISTTPFSCPWDSGQIGFTYIPRQKMLNEWKTNRISKQLKEKAREIILSEVTAYDQYLSGQVYGYVIEDKEGNHLNSCYGLFGYDYTVQEAKETAKTEYAVTAIIP